MRGQIYFLITILLFTYGLARAESSTSSSIPHYNLRQLVEKARATYPGVEAAREAITAMEQEVFRAKWAWVPQGTTKGLLAPAPKVACIPGPNLCLQTNDFSINSFKIQGYLARIELEMGMPIYTFDKLGAAKRAAGAGLEMKQEQLRISQESVTQTVTKAYWGLKLAREIIYTVEDGKSYLTDAQKKIEEELESEEGEATMTDLLRLKTFSAEIDSRILEAKKLETLTLATLAAMTGQKQNQFDVDTKVIEVLPGTVRPVSDYLDLARQHRPEIKILTAAVRARHAAVDLEHARFFPDFLLVAMVGYAYTSSVDDPQNAFYSDPFNFTSAGFGLALNWKFDQVQQYGKYEIAKAEARQTVAQKAEALTGIDLEIQKAQVDLTEAQERLATTDGGQKSARRWLVATSQNITSGLSEPRDLTDSLLAYFQLRLRYLQAMYDVNVGWSELGRVIGIAARDQQ